MPDDGRAQTPDGQPAILTGADYIPIVDACGGYVDPYDPNQQVPSMPPVPADTSFVYYTDLEYPDVPISPSDGVVTVETYVCCPCSPDDAYDYSVQIDPATTGAEVIATVAAEKATTPAKHRIKPAPKVRRTNLRVRISLKGAPPTTDPAVVVMTTTDVGNGGSAALLRLGRTPTVDSSHLQRLRLGDTTLEPSAATNPTYSVDGRIVRSNAGEKMKVEVALYYIDNGALKLVGNPADATINKQKLGKEFSLSGQISGPAVPRHGVVIARGKGDAAGDWVAATVQFMPA